VHLFNQAERFGGTDSVGMGLSRGSFIPSGFLKTKNKNERKRTK
jgi:hypothetical protein